MYVPPHFGIADKVFVNFISQLSRELIAHCCTDATALLSVALGGFDLLLSVTISKLRRRDLYAGDGT